VHKAVTALIAENKKLQKEIQDIQKEQAGGLKDGLLAGAEKVGSFTLVAQMVDLPDLGMLKGLTFELQQSISPGIVILGAAAGDKVQLMISRDRIDDMKELHAGQVIRESAKLIRGGGGGQPFFASAGGSDKSGLQAAIDHAKELVIKAIS